jgi:hypothetical protein
MQGVGFCTSGVFAGCLAKDLGSSLGGLGFACSFVQIRQLFNQFDHKTCSVSCSKIDDWGVADD